MANPYSGYGISDRDYAATVAALAGEMSPKAKQDDVDRILDSIVNRAEQNSARRPDGTVERASLGSVVTASGQYDAMRGIGNRDRGNARTNGGQRAAREAFVGALAPSKLSPEARTRVEMANKAIENVVVSGVSRGIAQGATDYRNAALTDRWGTGGMHRANENVYGSLEDATGHRFSGPGFNPDMEFDPVSLHGQLQDIGLPAELAGLTAPEVSIPAPDLPGALHGLETPDYSGITQGIPGMDPMQGFRVDVPNVPPADWTMEKPFDAVLVGLGLQNQRPSENVSIAPREMTSSQRVALSVVNDPSVPKDIRDMAAKDLAGELDREMAGMFVGLTTPEVPGFTMDPTAAVDYGKTYPDMSAGLWGDEVNFGPSNVPSVPDPMTTMDGPTYPGLSQSMYDGPPVGDVSAPSVPDINGLSLDNYGPTMAEAPQRGFHSAMDAGPYGSVPDFNAPSLNEREQFDRVADPITSYSYDSVTHGLNDALMNELSPKTHSVPEAYTTLETRTREVPFSAPNSLQAAVMGDWEDKLGPAKPGMASKPQSRIETYEVPVQHTRMVEQPIATPKALPSQDIGAPPALSSSFASAPTSLGDAFGAGQHGFDGFMAGIGARDHAAMDAVDKAGMGYAASYAMGDGPYATMGTNDLQDRFGKEFGMDARKGIGEGFKQDYGQLSPTARGGLEGGLKGLAMGGPLGMLGGGILGALGGYALPNGLSGLFDGTFGTGLERGTPGNMSNFGSPYDGAGLAGPFDSLFGGAPGSAGNMHDMQAIQDAYDARNGGGLGGLFGGGSFGGDPSQDGGARYS